MLNARFDSNVMLFVGAALGVGGFGNEVAVDEIKGVPMDVGVLTTIVDVGASVGLATNVHAHNSSTTTHKTGLRIFRIDALTDTTAPTVHHQQCAGMP